MPTQSAESAAQEPPRSGYAEGEPRDKNSIHPFPPAVIAIGAAEIRNRAQKALLETLLGRFQSLLAPVANSTLRVVEPYPRGSSSTIHNESHLRIRK